MSHENEYHDALIAMLELIWGDGFMTPGGPENVARTVEGLELRDRRVLDIGCGIGGPALVLAEQFGARVVGIDLEAPLVERARRKAQARGLAERVEFRAVERGPLGFESASLDVVFSAGAFTQTEDKLGAFRDVARVLRPGGVFTCYDWMRSEAPYSDDMRYWFELEGLTYAMETLESHQRILEEAGFVSVQVRDGSRWYRRRVREEYERMKGPLYPRMIEAIGREQAEHFLENWRAMVVVCETGEMRQGYYRGTTPR